MVPPFLIRAEIRGRSHRSGHAEGGDRGELDDLELFSLPSYLYRQTHPVSSAAKILLKTPILH